MKSFSDSEIMEGVRKTHTYAKTAQREGAGTHRNSGDAGRIAAEWSMWLREAQRRGLLTRAKP